MKKQIEIVVSHWIPSANSVGGEIKRQKYERTEEAMLDYAKHKLIRRGVLVTVRPLYLDDANKRSFHEWRSTDGAAFERIEFNGATTNVAG